MWAAGRRLPPWWKSETEMITAPRDVIAACLKFLVDHGGSHFHEFGELNPSLFSRGPERPGDFYRFKEQVADCLHLAVRWRGDPAVDEIRELCLKPSVERVSAAYGIAKRDGFVAREPPVGVAKKTRAENRPGSAAMPLWRFLLKTQDTLPTGKGLPAPRIGKLSGIGLPSVRRPIQKMRDEGYLEEVKNGWRLTPLGLEKAKEIVKKWP
jgi:hypothetical protein